MCPVQFEGEDLFNREVFVRIRWETLQVYLNDIVIYDCDYEYLHEKKPLKEILEMIGFDTEQFGIF
ncbi:hypothetical protein D3C81_2201640 [compost metagenome]